MLSFRSWPMVACKVSWDAAMLVMVVTTVQPVTTQGSTSEGKCRFNIIIQICRFCTCREVPNEFEEHVLDGLHFTIQSYVQ